MKNISTPTMKNISTPVAGNQKTLLPGADAAAYLQMSRTNFANHVKSGRLPQPIRITPARPVWRLADLQAFIESL